MTYLSDLLRFLWSPVAALWGEVIGLRTEQIRSLAVVAGLVLMFRGFGRITDGASLTDPYVVLTLLGMVMTFGLAWQANHIKGQIAGVRFQLGKQEQADERMFAEPVKSPRPDNPDGE